MHAAFALHAAKHAADVLVVPAAGWSADANGVPLRIMSGSIAVGKFIINVTSSAAAAVVEAASVNAAIGLAEASISLTL